MGITWTAHNVSDAVFAGQNEDVEGMACSAPSSCSSEKRRHQREEQTKKFCVQRAMGDRKVVVRTLDAGVINRLRFTQLVKRKTRARQRGLRLSMVREDLIDAQPGSHCG